MLTDETLSTFAGVYSLIMTPFHEDGSIDWKVYEQYLDYQISHRPHNLFPVCGSSEMKDLTLEERLHSATLTVRHAPREMRVIATANLEEGRQAQKEEVRRMEQTGVDALVFTSRGIGDRPEELFETLCELASCTTLPVMLYEFPGYPGQKIIDSDTYARLIQTGRFIGIKDTTCQMDLITEKIQKAPQSDVLQANIPYLYDAMKAGAKGVIATISVIMTKTLRKFWELYTSGAPQEQLEELNANIVNSAAVIDSCFPAGPKYLFGARIGIPMTPVTRSRQILSPERARAYEIWYDWAVRHEIL